MRNAYRILATIIAVDVVIQAMAIVFAISGLTIWVNDGNTFDKAVLEAQDAEFTGVVGFPIHFLNGTIVIPLLGLLLLIVSFLAKLPGGVKWAAIVFAAIVVQVFLGLSSHESAYFGLLHGLNAFILLGSAINAARLARAADAAPSTVAA
jgi:hypothetical protein